MLVESTISGYHTSHLQGNRFNDLRMFLRSGFEESAHGQTKERGPSTRKNARKSLQVYRNVIRKER